MPAPALQCGARRLSLQGPQLMGILNITPDSFSDGGELYRDGAADVAAALQRARAMCEAGAAILDVGGESTRPGALPVSEQEEMDRVLPVVEALCGELPAVVSVDTSSPALMREAVALGAGMINDVRALRRPGAVEAAAKSGAAVCLVHLQGEPQTMQESPHYEDLLGEVREFLVRRVAACQAAGIGTERLVLDPGFGFGKTPEHNLELLNRLDALRIGDLPLLVGVSRKSTIRRILGDEEQLLCGGLALAALAVVRGARLIRTHDVAPTAAALRVLEQALGLKAVEDLAP